MIANLMTVFSKIITATISKDEKAQYVDLAKCVQICNGYIYIGHNRAMVKLNKKGIAYPEGTYYFDQLPTLVSPTRPMGLDWTAEQASHDVFERYTVSPNIIDAMLDYSEAVEGYTKAKRKACWLKQDFSDSIKSVQLKGDSDRYILISSFHDETFPAIKAPLHGGMPMPSCNFPEMYLTREMLIILKKLVDQLKKSRKPDSVQLTVIGKKRPRMLMVSLNNDWDDISFYVPVAIY